MTRTDLTEAAQMAAYSMLASEGFIDADACVDAASDDLDRVPSLEDRAVIREAILAFRDMGR